MRLKVLLLLLCFIVAVSAGKKKKKLVTEPPIGAYGEDATFILNQPVTKNAKKFSKVMKDQNVVGTCRYLLFKAMKTWDDAKDSCDNLILPMTLRVKGSMATIKTEDENKDMVMLMKMAHGVKHEGGKFDRLNWVWLGLKKIMNTGVHLSKQETGEANFNASEWRWVDGSIPEFWRWMRDMPDQDYDKKKNIFQDTVSLNKKGRWDDSFGQKKMPYACNYCGKYIVVQKHVKWDQAKELCESMGLTMAKINNREENEELDMAARLMMGDEVDERRWNQTNWIWIGTREVMDEEGVGTGVWRHHDGTQLLWDNPPWDFKRQPDNEIRGRKGEQQVLAFSRINTKWDDSFPHKKRPFACMCPEAACTTNVY